MAASPQPGPGGRSLPPEHSHEVPHANGINHGGELRAMETPMVVDGDEHVDESSEGGILHKSALQHAFADPSVAWDLLDENVFQQLVPAPPVLFPTSVAPGVAPASSAGGGTRRGRGRSTSGSRPGPYSEPPQKHTSPQQQQHSADQAPSDHAPLEASSRRDDDRSSSSRPIPTCAATQVLREDRRSDSEVDLTSVSESDARHDLRDRRDPLGALAEQMATMQSSILSTLRVSLREVNETQHRQGEQLDSLSQKV